MFLNLKKNSPLAKGYTQSVVRVCSGAFSNFLSFKNPMFLKLKKISLNQGYPQSIVRVCSGNHTYQEGYTYLLYH